MTSGNNSGWEHYIARLKDWPYASRQLLQAPISDLIDGHAIALISRALNIGRVTAFVGSGASMAYGRIGWTDMIKTVQERALHRYEETEPDLRFFPAAKVRAERLRELLTFHSISQNARADVNQQLTVFQLAEELHRELDRVERQRPSSFRDDIMWLTHDDRAHIEQLLISAFRQRGRPGERLIAPDKETGKDQPIKDNALWHLIQECLWGEGPPPEYDRYLPWLDLDRTDLFHGLFRPLERHSVAAKLTAMSEKLRVRAIERLGKQLALLRDPAGSRSSGPRPRWPRRLTISAHQDPLAIIIETLKINRFLTTNYDREIERALEDRGMWLAPVEARGVHSARSSQSDPLSHSYHDVVFTHEHHGELAALAARDRMDNAWVVHLHGRSEKGSPTGIVATERDYQERYERDHGTRDLINASTSIALGASPILFLGVGMDEMDLLRPLRQFMSSPRRIGDRIAVALLPMFDDEKKAQLRQIQLLQQYGVYVLHYGNRFEMHASGDGPGRSGFAGTAWLHRVAGLKSSIADVLAATDELDDIEVPRNDEAGHPKRIRGRQVIARIGQTVDDLETFLRKPGNEEALAFLVKPVGTRLDGHQLCQESGASLTKAAEVFTTALALVRNLPSALRSLGLAGSLRNLGKGARREIAALRRQVMATKVELDGTLNAIVTTLLCHRLTSLGREWQIWRQNWYRLPKQRDVRLGLSAAQTHNPNSTSATGADVAPIHRPRPARSLSIEVIAKRHTLNLSDRPDAAKNVHTRFFAGAASQTFDTFFISLLAGGHKPTFERTLGRKIMVFAAPNGVGKGHFFSALQQFSEGDTINYAERLPYFLNAIRPLSTKHYVVAFFNLSLSTEVSSVFDKVTETIWYFIDRNLLPNAPRIERAAIARDVEERESLRRDRLGGLSFALRVLRRLTAFMRDGNASHGAADQSRLLIAINAFGLMFRANGEPKNRQVDAFWSILLADDMKDVPIDFVLVNSTENIPYFFRRHSSNIASSRPLDLNHPGCPRIDHLHRPDLSTRGMVKIREILHSGFVDERREAADDWRVDHYLHFIHRARVSSIATGYFPTVVLGLALHMIWSAPSDDPVSRLIEFADAVGRSAKAGTGTPRIRFNNFHPSAAQKIRAAVRDVLGKPATHLDEIRRKKINVPSTGLVRAISFLAGRSDPQQYKDHLSDLIKNSTGNIIFEDKKADQYVRFLSYRYFKLARRDKNNVIRHTFLKGITNSIKEFYYRFDAIMRKIHYISGESRYLSTLILASTYEIIHTGIPKTRTKFIFPTSKKNDSDRKPNMGVVIRPKELTFLKERIHQAMEFIDGLERGLRGADSSARPYRIVGLVADRLMQHHDELPGLLAPDERLKSSTPFVVGIPPRRITVLGTKGIPVPRLEIGRPFYDVQQWVLWHLAVFGYPVELELLLQCPYLIEAIEQAVIADDRSQVGRDGSTSRGFSANTTIRGEQFRRILKWILDVLVNRCLVFEIAANRDDASMAELSADTFLRYAIHRSVRNYCFQQMRASIRDYIGTDEYTITLYADQPNNVPRLTPEAHQFLRTTVAALSGYPEDPEGGAAYDAVTELGASGYRTRMLMLRGAFGILRSTYSIANLAQLDLDHERLNPAEPDEGISSRAGIFEELRRQIRWLIRQAAELTHRTEDRGNGGDEDAYSPFFAEELVWLYNECGVLSLAEGRLSDAGALFDMADRAAANLEPGRTGPLRSLVALNKAITQVERGRLRAAKRTFEAIANDPRNTDSVRAIALGYEGLVDHIRGHFVHAEQKYSSAIDVLLTHGKTRAASILSRHLGDMLRRMGPDRRQESLARLDNAVRLSVEHNHEDTRYLALLSQVRATLGNSSSTNSEESKKIHGILNTVEQYAVLMGIPRLMIEATDLRADLHFRTGDLRTAGSVCAKCLELASLHEMRLRKVSALLKLAQINHARGMNHASVVIAREATTLAHDTEHHSVSMEVDALVHKLQSAGH